MNYSDYSSLSKENRCLALLVLAEESAAKRNHPLTQEDIKEITRAVFQESGKPADQQIAESVKASIRDLTNSTSAAYPNKVIHCASSALHLFLSNSTSKSDQERLQFEIQILDQCKEKLEDAFLLRSVIDSQKPIERLLKDDDFLKMFENLRTMYGREKGFPPVALLSIAQLWDNNEGCLHLKKFISLSSNLKNKQFQNPLNQTFALKFAIDCQSLINSHLNVLAASKQIKIDQQLREIFDPIMQSVIEQHLTFEEVGILHQLYQTCVDFVAAQSDHSAKILWRLIQPNLNIDPEEVTQSFLINGMIPEKTALIVDLIEDAKFYPHLGPLTRNQLLQLVDQAFQLALKDSK